MDQKITREELTQIFKALGDINRIEIIEHLSQEEKCVCELLEEMKLSQPSLSHHLKTLKQAGLIKDRREGKWIFYAVNHQYYEDILNLVNSRLGKKITTYKKEKRTIPRIECKGI